VLLLPTGAGMASGNLRKLNTYSGRGPGTSGSVPGSHIDSCGRSCWAEACIGCSSDCTHSVAATTTVM
jgi:hypothetical protein